MSTYCISLEGVILSYGAPGLAQAMRIVIAHLSDINEQLEGWLERVQARNRDTGSRRGRPKMVITEDQLIQLLNSHFSVPDISRMLQCSRRTIYRRIQEFGLSNSLHSVVSDSDLDLIVSEFVQCHPMSGHRILIGHFRSLNIRIPRQRARDSLIRVDPTGVANRLRKTLHRRQYSVIGLWHVDGYHKLINWKIVIHGGIDGYSRLIVYLKAANNRAATVLSSFLEGVDEYGLPSSGENVGISEYMLNHPYRGPSMITGRSVHNQRIERFWYAGCISSFYTLFCELESAGLLNPNDDNDLFSLCHTFTESADVRI